MGKRKESKARQNRTFCLSESELQKLALWTYVQVIDIGP